MVFAMKKFLFAAALVLLVTASATAQGAKPDFSGKWNLDVAKSDFGRRRRPSGSST